MLPIHRCLRLVIVISVTTIHGFNIDVQNPAIATGEQGSYFGYSLAVHNDAISKRLLIGAPKGRHVNNGTSGALYLCSRGTTNFLNCESGNSSPPGAQGKDEWFGATVVSQNGTAMVCAPRSGDYFYGECFYGRGTLSSFNPISSLNKKEQYCQYGFSAALSSDGTRFYVGGPSCENNDGKLVATTISTQGSYDKYSGPISYLAYAMASGKVYNTMEGLVISIGFDLDQDFMGKVLILDSLTTLRQHSILRGFQVGEHFGASLAVTDINNDGRDDIIIGAPHHSDYKNSGTNYDIGAVYIYYQRYDGSYVRGNTNELILKGERSGAQFGYSVSALGDTNGDGFNDVAIGAPYDNDGAGAVYIFHGSKKGLRVQPGQVISGNSFNPPILSFGFSFASGASDFDNNLYNDLIVGAYQSDKVVLLPARPVVKVKSQITFDPKFISFEKKDCVVQSSSGSLIQVACTTMSYCLTYDGIGVPRKTDLKLNITLDAKQPKIHRLLFLKTNQYRLTQTIGLEMKSQFCLNEVIYIQPDYRVQISSMDVTLVTSLPEATGALLPVLDIYEGNGYTSNTLAVRRNCSSNLVCVPDLKMTITTSSRTLIQGSDESWVMNVAIFNAGEEAYGVQFFLELPNVMKYVQTDQDYTDTSVSCSPPSDANGPVLVCDVGSSLPANKTAHLSIIIQPTSTYEKSLSLVAETNSTDTEKDETLSDNKQTITLTFIANTTLALSGWSQPDSLSINTTALKTNGSNSIPHYTQFYEVRNVGPSDVVSGRFRIVFPTHTPEGYSINELTAQPTVNGSATCDTVSIASRAQETAGIDINCEFGRMARNARAVIILMAKLSPEAFLKQENIDVFKLTSKLSASITALPFDQDVSTIPNPTVNNLVDLEVTRIKKEANVVTAIPPWIPIVSAVGALVIIAGMVGGFHKMGFFKRNRPHLMKADRQTIPDSQPLQEMSQIQDRPMSERDNTVDEDSS